MKTMNEDFSYLKCNVIFKLIYSGNNVIVERRRTKKQI